MNRLPAMWEDRIILLPRHCNVVQFPPPARGRGKLAGDAIYRFVDVNKSDLFTGRMMRWDETSDVVTPAFCMFEISRSLRRLSQAGSSSFLNSDADDRLTTLAAIYDGLGRASADTNSDTNRCVLVRTLNA